MTKNGQIVLLVWLCLIVPEIGLPGTAGSIQEATSWATVATLSAGPAWYHAGRTQTIDLQPDFTNTYVTHQEEHLIASGEFFLGLQKQPMGSTWRGQLGLAVAINSGARTQGDIWELSEPDFDNFTYQYKITQTRVTLKGKLLSTVFSETWLPYVSAGVGTGFNKTYNFAMSPKIFAAIPVPAFKCNSQTALSYTVGAGLQHALNQYLHVGIGYELADWGKSNLSPATGQVSGTGLEFNHLYTNQLQFSLSYLA